MKKQKAITLISLVITIIVLLIVVGIGINFVIGEYGIMKQAQHAGEAYQKESVKENLKIKILDVQAKIVEEEKREATLLDLKTQFDQDTQITKIELNDLQNPTEATVTIDGYTFYIDDKLQIIEENIQRPKWGYNFTGDVQEFIAPETGNYIIECWGAGTDATTGGYTKGTISLQKGTKLYLYVGGKNNGVTGGYNGGGNSGTYGSAEIGGAGATDIRLTNGQWNDFDSLKSRIMVAGGAGAMASSNDVIPHAGGLIGYNSRATNYYSYGGNGGSQTQGGAMPSNHSGISGLTAGQFGIGGNGNRAINKGYGGGRRRRILWWFRWKWSRSRRLGPEEEVHHLYQDIWAVMP